MKNMIKPFKEYTEEDFKSIIERINPDNKEYYEHICYNESVSNKLIFIHNRYLNNFLEAGPINNYKDFIYRFFSHKFNSYDPITYPTLQVDLSKSYEVLYEDLEDSTMRSFEDILILTLTYFPETHYLDVFETLLSLVKFRRNEHYAFIDFYYCDEIYKINCLKNERDINLNTDKEMLLLSILKTKIRGIENTHETFENYQYDGENLSMRSWLDLFNQLLEKKGQTESEFIDTFKQHIITLGNLGCIE